jgi:Rrf2 family protein
MHFSQCYDLAVHGLCCLAAQPDGRLVAAKNIATALNAKLTYLAKVLQALTHAGLVRSARGKLGGYGLKRPASEITLADILKALDTHSEIYLCPGNRGCKRSNGCAIQTAFGKASKALSEEFEKVTLAQIVGDLRGPDGASAPTWINVPGR